MPAQVLPPREERARTWSSCTTERHVAVVSALCDDADRDGLEPRGQATPSAQEQRDEVATLRSALAEARAQSDHARAKQHQAEDVPHVPPELPDWLTTRSDHGGHGAERRQGSAVQLAKTALILAAYV